MKQLQAQSVFFLLFILHQSLCQQSTPQYSQQNAQQYSQQSQSQPQYTQQGQAQAQYSQPAVQYTQTPQPGKVQLEDIERDNLKGSQTPATNTQQVQQVQVQPQQYLAYPQDQIFYIQPQQAALFQTPQQQIPNFYAAQPSPAGVVSQPQQQQQVYLQPYYTQQPAVGGAAQITPQSYPSYVDFSGFPLYPSAYPYVQSNQIPQASPNLIADYFKSAAVQPSAAQVKTPLSPVHPSLKTAQPTQVPNLNNYLLSNTLPNAYYQPVSFAQPQNAQFYNPYNSFYQVPQPTAAKSVFSSGIKSTTPSSPTKLKDEPFVPVHNGNYRFDFATAEQNNYNKVRSG